MCKVMAERITPQRISGTAIVVTEADYAAYRQNKHRKTVTLVLTGDGTAVGPLDDRGADQIDADPAHVITGHFAGGKLFQFDFVITYGAQFDASDGYRLVKSINMHSCSDGEMDCDPEQLALLGTFVEVLFTRMSAERDVVDEQIKFGEQNRVRVLEKALDEVTST
jgi:hypothetical protein